MTNNVLDNPSIAGGVIADFVGDIASREIMSQPRLALLSALQSVSIAVSKARGMCFGYEPQKPSLFTMGVAPTAAGKDAGLSFLKRAAFEAKVYYQTDIPSDKDLKFNFVREQGQYALIIDEMDSLIAKMGSKQSYESGIVAVLLEMYTASNMVISNKYKEEMIEKLKKDREKIIKAEGSSMKEAGIPDSVSEQASRVMSASGDNNLESKSLALQLIDKKIDILENGVKNPLLNLHGVATPRAISSNLKLEHSDRGLLGRFIVFDCPGRPEKDLKALRRRRRASYATPASEPKDVFESMARMIRSITPGMIPDYDEDCPELIAIEDDMERRELEALNKGYAVCGRMVANWFKIASLFAFSEMDTTSPNPKPRITARHGEFARQVIIESVRSTILITTADDDDDDLEQSNKDMLISRVLKKAATGKNGSYVSAIFTDITRSKKGKNLVQSLYPDDADLRPCFDIFVYEMEQAGIVEYVGGDFKRIRRV